MNILVFSTSVKEKRQVNKVTTLLTKIPAIAQWNFDLEDCDNILRIEADNLSPRYIERLLIGAGINCRELEY
ncbi:hypothetical protein [Mucilaginibacter ginsenosidivorax]|uniref:Copper chaperone n=1 Tax=Mucilaginibacter ginsenosidivorax TaxID=862126 RepID=A0A5B8W859_9SPHI|nr:hypothetical protein [Mucilaginibacter ginsenosidivorax]QEC79112.1 hypothetical protein FSB76_25325 [Mucilaginibacter ginsenosidivorax]